MPEMLEGAAVQTRLATLPVETYQAGVTVLAAGAITGRLLILKEGAVEVVKDGVRIGTVAEPGAVFGELAVLLDQPHTADVRTLEASAFHVADAGTFLREDPAAALYVAAILARRLDGANRALIELRHQIEADQPRSVIARALDRLAEALRHGHDPHLVGYPSIPWI